MNFRAMLAVAASIFLAALATTRAQSTPSQPSTAQSRNAGAGDSDVAPAPPAKKVWTNDDLNDLHDSPAPTPVRAFSKPALPPAPRAKADAKWYRSQIAKLQSQISTLDPKIAALQGAIEGKQVDEPRKYGWVQPGNWPDQLAQLQTKRAGLLDQISTLEDEARHKGIAASDLP